MRYNETDGRIQNLALCFANKCGSALVGAIWILAVLSVLIATYAVDAQLQTRINLYLQERVRVDHLTDAGIAIAEVIMLDYKNVTVDEETNYEEKLEDDRWYMEKVDLKDNRECSTGAVPVDALNPEGGTVTVKIKPIEAKWNINNLYAGGDANFAKIWEAILAACSVPEEYWDGIVDSWCDWRDSDGTMTGEGGAESDFYKSAYEDFIDGKDVEKNANYLPASRDGELVDLDDLIHLKGFNEYEDEPINPHAILDGGILNPTADKEDQIEIKGIRKYFTVFGSGKINANIADADILVTVPGIWQPSATGSSSFSEQDVSNATDIASAIVEIRQTGNQRENLAGGKMDDDVGTFKDWNDLQSRVQDAIGGGSGYIQQEAQQYLSYAPEMFFEVTITGASLGITHTVKAVAIVQDSKVRYLRWQEDP
jgi:type II secretory pathway component PulK